MMKVDEIRIYLASSDRHDHTQNIPFLETARLNCAVVFQVLTLEHKVLLTDIDRLPLSHLLLDLKNRHVWFNIETMCSSGNCPYLDLHCSE